MDDQGKTRYHPQLTYNIIQWMVQWWLLVHSGKVGSVPIGMDGGWTGNTFFHWALLP
jgi:hypothetical protein